MKELVRYLLENLYLDFQGETSIDTVRQFLRGDESREAKALLANQLASPDVVFSQAIDASLSGNNPRRQPETPATVEQWNLATSLAFYNARFADASNFTFVFVGSFTPEAIKPFVETYIASLPATHARETWRDLGIAPPAVSGGSTR